MARGVRLLGGEHAGAVILEQRYGYAGGYARSVERPAKMLAGMAAANGKTMMFDHLVIERGGHVVLLGEWRRTLAFAAVQETGHLPRPPRAALRGAADHDGVGTG